MIHHSQYKYVRIQGRDLAANTLTGRGVFSVFQQLIQDGVMEQEDEDLYREIDSWFVEHLPFPPQCKRQEPVVCFFKASNAEEMLKWMKPALWLLDRYQVPHYLVYTNRPGEIVYEDDYQVVAKVDDIRILPLQKSWSPEETP